MLVRSSYFPSAFLQANESFASSSEPGLIRCSNDANPQVCEPPYKLVLGAAPKVAPLPDKWSKARFAKWFAAVEGGRWAHLAECFQLSGAQRLCAMSSKTVP